MDGCIDIHAHIVPKEFPEGPAHCCDVWPQNRHDDERSFTVMMGDKPFRKLDDRSWNVDARIADMDAQHVSLQALSPMPDLLSYWMPADGALELCRHINGSIAAMVSSAPARFAGLGMVPLQTPELAAKELARLKADGFAGIEIGSNISGISPGDAMFDPVYAECERLDLAIFVHALRPTTNDRLIGFKPALAAFVGFPSDTGLAAASFLTGRTLEKFPRLKIGFSHGGGTFASILPRLQNGWTIAPELKENMTLAPQLAAQMMFYDNITHHQPTLAYLLGLFGRTQLVAGSDYPYLAGQDFPGRPFEDLGVDARTLGLLKAGNARRFLGLGS